eukprot:GHVU01191750.1.p1 GENE.GHVU01191750.1~~GHVU01191750.1.p1  ORF type:complete len:772 (+),score=109.90 GHVU01191750.1:1231-3546(+)
MESVDAAEFPHGRANDLREQRGRPPPRQGGAGRGGGPGPAGRVLPGAPGRRSPKRQRRAAPRRRHSVVRGRLVPRKETRLRRPKTQRRDRVVRGPVAGGEAPRLRHREAEGRDGVLRGGVSRWEDARLRSAQVPRRRRLLRRGLAGRPETRLRHPLEPEEAGGLCGTVEEGAAAAQQRQQCTARQWCDAGEALAPPSAACRHVIVATNIAETSLTLPNVRYVVDCGKEKRRRYAASSDASVFRVDWASQASANQRAGRCGRVGPGHCYRLYSSAVFAHCFKEFPPVDLTNCPLDSVLLYMAALGIPRPSQFPFPSAPDKAALVAAQDRLTTLGALEPGAPPPESALGAFNLCKHPSPAIADRGAEGVCTPLGNSMAALPVPPRFARMFVEAATAFKKARDAGGLQLSCLLVAALATGPILASARLSDSSDCRRHQDDDCDDVNGLNLGVHPPRVAPHAAAPKFDSDVDAILWHCGAYVHAQDGEAFCRSFGLNAKQLQEARLLAEQLATTLNARTQSDGGVSVPLPLRPLPPTEKQKVVLRRCVLAGLLDHIAVRSDAMGTEAAAHLHRSSYRTGSLADGEFCFVHPASHVANLRPLPECVAYCTMFAGEATRQLMRECVPVPLAQLSRFACPLIVQAEFLRLPPPHYDARRDRCLAWIRHVYTPLRFSFPSVLAEIQDHFVLKYQIFAKALLEGSAFPRLTAPAAAVVAKTEPDKGRPAKLRPGKGGCGYRPREDARLLLRDFRQVPFALKQIVTLLRDRRCHSRSVHSP